MGFTKGLLQFELGMLRFNRKDGDPISLACEEITVSFEQENYVRYTCDLISPVSIHPSKKRFAFNIKRPKFVETDVLTVQALYEGDFTLYLYRILSKSELESLGYKVNKQLRILENYHKEDIFSYKEFLDPFRSKRVPGVAVKKGAKIGEIKGALVGNYFIQHIMSLHHCYIDSFNFGNFDGTKPVTEEINGVAEYFTYPPGVGAYYIKQEFDEWSLLE